MPSIDIHSPLQEAVDMMAAKTVFGSSKSSRELNLLPAEVRLRLMFSARMEHEQTLAEMQSRILAGVSNQKVDGVTMGRARFVEAMAEIMRENGYVRPDGVGRHSLRNHRSRARLELIWDMNVAQGRGYARWMADMNPLDLENEPCYELDRIEARAKPRDWFERWMLAGGKIYDGRMIARKTDPIWIAISRFGTPWPPFDWGSGMGLIGIDIDEAEALGVVAPDEPPQEPLSRPFNADCSASADGLTEERIAAILRDFAGDVERADDRLRIVPPRDAMGSGDRKKSKVVPPSFDRVNQPPKPAPIRPIAEVIRAKSPEVRRAIDLIGQVHDVAGLPEMKIESRRLSFGVAGDYSPAVSSAGEAKIVISPLALDPAFAATHEIGHLVDNLGLHSPTETRRYASAGQPDLQPIMRAIRKTTAYSRIYQRCLDEGVGYWVKNQELFARAYAQWIAAETKDPGLLEVIQKIRLSKWEKSGVWKESQWTTPDFSAVRREFEKLFTTLRWKTGR